MAEIDIGTEIRFRRRDRGRWHLGKVTGFADEGTAVWILDEFTGATRCLRTEQIEIPDRGPRGGKIWITPQH